MDKEKTVHVTKDQFIASLGIARDLAKQEGGFDEYFTDVLTAMTEQLGPVLPDKWFVDIEIKDYENVEYDGEDDE